jgi:hypothetical protein
MDFLVAPAVLSFYTEMTSKIGVLTRKRPEFELGLPMPKQLNLNKLSDGGKLKISSC